MRGFFVVRRPAVNVRSLTLLSIAASLGLLTATPAFAIPSPELVVGSLSSLSQVVALVFATLSGGAALIGARVATTRGGSKATSRAVLWTAIGAFVCLIASIGVNVWQFTNNKAAIQDRLEATLIRPTPLGPDGKPLDDKIREPAWEEQLTATNGMSTTEVEKFLEEYNRGEHPDIIFGDIREAVELEMGSPPGATPLRFADLSNGKVNFSQKKAVLVCHTGIRSYDMCNRLKEMGIDCQFMVGGIEKWLVERRPLTGYRVRTLKDLRALPPYRNQAVLLDTPEVRKLVEEEKALFVDPRLPGEFRYTHLPNAINFTLRQTSQEDIPQKIAEVPKRPIIVPCYDRRSCFYAEALGLQFARAGYDYRGRYTVPWDYFVKPKPRPFVQQWLKELNETWWDKATALLASALRTSADHIGFLASILLLALISRLLVLPVSIKAERDQIASRDLEPEVKEIKAKYADDPRRRAREMRAFYARHGLTPVRNLLGLAFLPLMALCVAATHEVAASSKAGLFWMANAGERDLTFVLPVLFAALICVYLDIAFARTWKHRLLTWLIGIPVFVATGTLLSGAADVYVVAAVALLLVQRAYIGGQFSRLAQAWSRARRDSDMIPLTDIEGMAGRGNKAYRLAKLHAAGIEVPEGLVLTSRFLARFATGTSTWRREQLDRLWQKIGAKSLAVRSSASAEDGNANSFAGVFESVLNVDRPQLEGAIVDVLASFDSDRARSYGAHGDKNILVQTMIDAEYAGVLFTHDPACDGLSLVELVRGTADRLVSGSVAPDSFRLGRLTGQIIGEKQSPIDLKPLVEIGRRAEMLFGAPQDIEWTYSAGRFQLVQSRDITRVLESTDGDAVVRREWQRILDLAAGASPDAVVFAQNEVSEVLPRPTPLSLSLMESLWASRGSVDLACQALNLTYPVDDESPSYLVTLFGSLYVNKRQERARALQVNLLAMRRLRKSAQAIETAFREQFLPEFRAEINLLEAIDFERMAKDELFDAITRIRNDLVTRTHVEVEIINIAADLLLRDAKKKLQDAKLDPVRFLAPADRGTFEQVLSDAATAAPYDRTALLAKGLGHRARLDYELAEPRYSESPSEMLALQSISIPSIDVVELDLEIRQVAGGDAILAAVQLARRFETLKEDAKHHSLRQIAVLRRAVLALDRKLGFDGLLFYLGFGELASLRGEAATSLRATAAERRTQARIFAREPALPAKLTLAQLEDASAGIAIESRSHDGKVVGTRVSGKGTVEGRACVVPAADLEANTAIPGFQDGDIVVARMVPPAWIPYFKRAGGFVCEIGGWLSHSAIVAREYGVPLIVGTNGIEAIRGGMQLRLHPDGVIEVLAEAPVAVAAE